GIVRSEWGECVARTDRAFREDPRIDPGLARIAALEHPGEVAVDEPRGVRGAWRGVPGDLELDIIADSVAVPGHHGRPVDSGHGEVLAGVSRCHVVALALHPLDHLQREETEGAIGAAVMPHVVMAVTDDTEA